MPEGHAIGRIDRCHAIIAPAADGVELGTSAVEHYGFALREVTWRIGGEASRITNAWEHGAAG
ncbi:MAG: hypothetical protein DME96_12010 [Verrucomicrobia bacterium]|nr:MAG: hypothetical protein DME96_12010 [Verrucomicrobiota bacterium]